MTTLTIRIPIASEWPTSKELAHRNKVEAALNASGIMRGTGAGGGLGKMDLSFHVDDASRLPVARAKIEAAMALLMPDFEYEVALQSEPVRTFQVKVGDVFAIRLAESRYALGICRFVFQRMKGLTACRILDALIPEPKFVGPVSAATGLDPIFVYDHSITDGSWPIVGTTAVESAPLKYRSAGGIYNGEEYNRVTDYSEDVPDLLVSGPVALENHLREHFGLPSPVEGQGRTKRCT